MTDSIEKIVAEMREPSPDNGQPVTEADLRFAIMDWADRLAALGEAVPYRAGNTYQRQDGSWVKIVAELNDHKGYETVRDENDCHYYNRTGPDRGRCTGTAHDYSDPRNLVRLYTHPARPDSGWVRLMDSDWVNIVNAPSVLEPCTFMSMGHRHAAEEAVARAVKLTEARLKALNAPQPNAEGVGNG